MKESKLSKRVLNSFTVWITLVGIFCGIALITTQPVWSFIVFTGVLIWLLLAIAVETRLK